MSESRQEDWKRTIEGVYLMMKLGYSARRAAKMAGLPYRKFLKLASEALEKRPNGRYRAKRVDRLLRVVGHLTSKGLEDIAARDSREASKEGKFWAALNRFVTTGDARGIRQFRGKHVIDSNGVAHPFLTNLITLDQLANAGELSFESFYRKG
jgi:hypothetical protein